MVSDVKVGL